jgi:hypothetical protein
MRAIARTRCGAAILVAGLLAPSVCLGADERSQDAEACFTAAEAAQPMLRERRLREARQKLEVCSRDACPRAARADCRTWLAQVVRELPTVVFAAREEGPGGDFRPIREVRVLVDGELVVARLDGEPVFVDPGLHTVRFERAPNDAVERRIELLEGESLRAIEVDFGAHPRPPGERPVANRTAPAPVRAAIPPPAAPAASTPPSVVPPAAIALGAAGAVALAAGVVMEVLGLSDRQHLVDTCEADRSCAPADVEAARTRVMAGDIALGASAILSASAAYVYFTRATGARRGSGVSSLRLGSMAAGLGVGVEGSL